MDRFEKFVRKTHVDHHEMFEFYWDNETVHQLMGHCIRAIKKNKGYGLGQKREVSKQTNKQTNKQTKKIKNFNAKFFC